MTKIFPVFFACHLSGPQRRRDPLLRRLEHLAHRPAAPRDQQALRRGADGRWSSRAARTTPPRATTPDGAKGKSPGNGAGERKPATGAPADNRARRRTATQWQRERSAHELRRTTQEEAEALNVDWIEVSARTLDDARELALDRLGVVADELEYEVIDEPKGGLFGFGRTEARIRARVKPLSREKPTDRRRRRSSERRPSGGSKRSDPAADAAAVMRPRPWASERTTPTAPTVPTRMPRRVTVERSPTPAAVGARRRRRSRRRGRGRAGTGANARDATRSRRTPSRAASEDRPEASVNVDTDVEDADVEAQAEQAAEFTKSLVEAMGLTGTVSARVDDDTVLVHGRGRGSRPAGRAAGRRCRRSRKWSARSSSTV